MRRVPPPVRGHLHFEPNGRRGWSFRASRPGREEAGPHPSRCAGVRPPTRCVTGPERAQRRRPRRRPAPPGAAPGRGRVARDAPAAPGPSAHVLRGLVGQLPAEAAEHRVRRVDEHDPGGARVHAAEVARQSAGRAPPAGRPSRRRSGPHESRQTSTAGGSGPSRRTARPARTCSGPVCRYAAAVAGGQAAGFLARLVTRLHLQTPLDWLRAAASCITAHLSAVARSLGRSGAVAAAIAARSRLPPAAGDPA